MIVTLTANPSLDRTVVLSAALRPGDVQRAAGSREDAGGKGVNVARVLAAGGADVLAVVPVASDDPYLPLLRASGVPYSAADAGGAVRGNLTLTDPAGVTTKVNLPGPAFGAVVASSLVERTVAAGDGADWLVLAGSLPPGAPADFYVRVIQAVRSRWGSRAPRIAVDASGAALKEVVASGRPDLIKPNHEELAELVGASPASAATAAEAAARARALVPERAGAVLVTLGADGALLVTEQGTLYAPAPRVRVASTVGAGDSALAGYLLADSRGATPAQRLAHSIAYGAAAAALPGTQAPTPSDLPPGDIAVVTLT